jgi:hypothetical protein
MPSQGTAGRPADAARPHRCDSRDGGVRPAGGHVPTGGLIRRPVGQQGSTSPKPPRVGSTTVPPRTSTARPSGRSGAHRS